MPIINAAIVGVGLVGREFINQLLALPQPSPFRIVSISSSKTTIFSSAGLSLQSSWKSELETSSDRTDFTQLTGQLRGLVNDGKKVVLVDNTASEDVAHLYPTWLDAGIAVVTPNKKAFSGDLNLYERILTASEKSGAKFLNEATVGAGLPIISTLKDFVATGDKVMPPVAEFIRSDRPTPNI
jgi:homoserine dehydrogenase